VTLFGEYETNLPHCGAFEPENLAPLTDADRSFISIDQVSLYHHSVFGVFFGKRYDDGKRAKRLECSVMLQDVADARTRYFQALDIHTVLPGVVRDKRFCQGFAITYRGVRA